MTETDIALICKSLGDSNRLKVMNLLTDGEKCACTLLEELSITQPTLSHHMKKLSECGLVIIRKESKWNYYSINCKTMGEFKNYIAALQCKNPTN